VRGAFDVWLWSREIVKRYSSAPGRTGCWGDNKLDNKLDQDTENLEKEGDEAPAVLAAKKKRASE
jgi:hypothetical protein